MMGDVSGRRSIFGTAKGISIRLMPVHCSLLAEDAIKSAIKDYQTKREKRLKLAAVSPVALLPYPSIHPSISADKQEQASGPTLAAPSPVAA